MSMPAVVRVVLVASFALANAAAQDGQYRGPGSLLPRPPGPAPNGPGRVTPPPVAPTGPGRGGPGALHDPDDPTQWQYWWELHKDALLLPQRATPRPWLRDSTRGDVVRWLRKVLGATTSGPLAAACMIALAKAGSDDPRAPLRDLFAARIGHGNRVVRHAAILALGLSTAATGADRDLLVELAGATPGGHAAAQRDVDPAMRAFALHGLGLLASRSPDVATKRIAAASFASVLAVREDQGRDHRVAAVLAIGHLGLRPNDHAPEAAAAAAALADLFDRAERRFDLARAHCPNAAARWFGPHGPHAAAWRERCYAQLDRARGADGLLAGSCVQALGRLATAYGDADDRAIAEACSDRLAAAMRHHPRAQVHNLAAIALAEIGGAGNLRRLLDALAIAGPPRRPWLTLALGVHLARRPRGTAFADDGEALAVLRDAVDARAPASDRGAAVVALALAGLARDGAAIRALCGEADDELAGHAWLATALLHGRARDGAGDDMPWPCSAGRPELERQLASALAFTGDVAACRRLAEGLRDSRNHAARFAATARTLGAVRAPGTLAPLLQLLLDESAPSVTRAAAAGALGCWLDPRSVPWNAALADGIAYHAAVESLLGPGGVLSLY
jgi:hypothetical protein